MDILNTKRKKDEYVKKYLIEVFPPKGKDVRSWYLTLKETMTRIGIPFYKKQGMSNLYQSCFILKKNNKYYIPLFKEMFIVDGQRNELTKDDIIRRNSIIIMLRDWNMLALTQKTLDDIIHNTPSVLDIKTRVKIFVLPFSKKKKWKLVQKYPIGIIKNAGYHQKKFNLKDE